MVPRDDLHDAGSRAEMESLVRGTHGDPFGFLGIHRRGGEYVVRTFQPHAQRVWVVDSATGGKRAELTRFVVGDFPVEMALDETGRTGYITCAVDNDVAVVDIPGRKVLRRIAVAGDPEGIVYSSK